jgi:hypothetical protein
MIDTSRNDALSLFVDAFAFLLYSDAGYHMGLATIVGANMYGGCHQR